MKLDKRSAARPRQYRQVRRASAAEATHSRIVDAYFALVRERWLDQITLDEVARAAGVTVQTVIRRFGGKQGLLAGVLERHKSEVLQRRKLPVGDIAQAVAAVVADYEASGDFLLRWLAQESREPALHAPLEAGRRGHRDWLAQAFAPFLDGLPRDARERRLDGLVVITDVYSWKLLRRDRGLAPAAVAATMTALAGAYAGEPRGPRK